MHTIHLMREAVAASDVFVLTELVRWDIRRILLPSTFREEQWERDAAKNDVAGIIILQR